MTNRRAATFAWCLYDWAVTPFPTIVTTFVISNYFAKAIAPDPTTGSARWGFMVGAAGAIIALLSPPLGAIADRMGHAKRGIAVSLAVIIVSAALLWFATPTPDSAVLTLVVSAAGIISVELGLLFYNALLPVIAPRDRIGRTSGWGWGAAYAGGLMCLIAALLLLVQPEHPVLGIPKTEAANYRATGPLVAVWAALFAWPLFLLVPDTKGTVRSTAAAVRLGMADLGQTVRSLSRYRNLAWFLVSSAIYRDGITTILGIGGLYAGGTFGMTLSEIITFGIGINITAAGGAASFAWLDDWLGSKRTVLLSLAGLIGFGAAIIAVHDKSLFFGLALALGIFVGPAQSASRSLAVRLSPEGEVGKVFGLYGLTGRAVSFTGPILYSWVTEVTHNQRAGVGTILVLLVAGAVLLLRVREPVLTGDQHIEDGQAYPAAT
jgi:UMF1 family MFS transporter